MYRRLKRIIIVVTALTLIVTMFATISFAANGPTKVVGKKTNIYSDVTKKAGDGNKGYVKCKARIYYKSKADKKNSKPCGFKMTSLSKNTDFSEPAKTRIRLSTFNCSWNTPYKSNGYYVVKGVWTWKLPEEQKPTHNSFTFKFK